MRLDLPAECSVNLAKALQLRVHLPSSWINAKRQRCSLVYFVSALYSDLREGSLAYDCQTPQGLQTMEADTSWHVLLGSSQATL